MLDELFRKYYLPLSIADLLAQLEIKNTCISIKDSFGKYHYANNSFAHLMGKQSIKNIIHYNDHDLTGNMGLFKTIKQHDECIREEAKPLHVHEEIHPLDAPHLVKKVTGVLYPLFDQDNATPSLILGLFRPCTKLLSLDLPTIFQLSLNELDQILLKKSYSVVWNGLMFQLSRREIGVIIATIRGLHAGEIAVQFALKQTTIESYLQAIKDKLGICYKSELIAAVLETNLLGQILL